MKNNFDYLDDLYKEDFIAQASIPLAMSKRSLECNVYENVTLLPSKIEPESSNFWSKGGVIDQFGGYIENSAMRAEGSMIKDRMNGSYAYDQKNIDRCDFDEAIYFGLFINHYGHFLVEVVSRLWIEIKNPTKLPIVYTSLDGKPIKKHYLDFFELLGIDSSRLILINTPTKIKKIHIPEVSVVVGAYYTSAYKEIFDVVRSKVVPKSFEKVYFSRTKFNKAIKTEFGEKDIEKFMMDNGFNIFYPEKLTLVEQISIIKGCKIFSGLLCTIPHCLLFAEDGVRAIIFKKNYLPYPHQFMVNKIKNLDVTWIDAYCSLFPVSHSEGPYWIVVNENVMRFATNQGYKLKRLSEINFKKLNHIWGLHLIAPKDTVFKTKGYEQYDALMIFKYFYEKYNLKNIINYRVPQKSFAICKILIDGERFKCIKLFNFFIKIKKY